MFFEDTHVNVHAYVCVNVYVVDASCKCMKHAHAYMCAHGIIPYKISLHLTSEMCTMQCDMRASCENSLQPTFDVRTFAHMATKTPYIKHQLST
jgi:hypothetical protein